MSLSYTSPIDGLNIIDRRGRYPGVSAQDIDSVAYSSFGKPFASLIFKSQSIKAYSPYRAYHTTTIPCLSLTSVFRFFAHAHLVGGKRERRAKGHLPKRVLSSLSPSSLYNQNS